ncbi:hypothetical protein IPH67_03450 [bacterium]|nr:MAG: hypothetical protein IPH67_03450 [bacterium]
MVGFYALLIKLRTHLNIHKNYDNAQGIYERLLDIARLVSASHDNEKKKIPDNLKSLHSINQNYLNLPYFIWWLFFIEHVFVSDDLDLKNVSPNETDQFKDFFVEFCKNQNSKIFDTNLCCETI